MHHRRSAKRRRGAGDRPVEARRNSRRRKIASDAYPHQFSGGMRQRVMIAMALASTEGAHCRRADHRARRDDPGANSRPDAANSNKDYGTAIVLITHDLGVVAEVCQRVVVMYAGRVVEEASAQDLFTAPQHPYTVGLPLRPFLVLGGCGQGKAGADWWACRLIAQPARGMPCLAPRCPTPGRNVPNRPHLHNWALGARLPAGSRARRTKRRARWPK